MPRRGSSSPGARAWLATATHAFAGERAYLARLAVAAGPVPSTPGAGDSDAAVLGQRHAIEMLAQSERNGCARRRGDGGGARLGGDPPRARLGGAPLRRRAAPFRRRRGRSGRSCGRRFRATAPDPARACSSGPSRSSSSITASGTCSRQGSRPERLTPSRHSSESWNPSVHLPRVHAQERARSFAGMTGTLSRTHLPAPPPLSRPHLT